jgi:hypothetical protein
MDVSALRMAARDLGISGVVQKPSSLEVQFLANTPVEPRTILRIAGERAGLHFKPGPPFTLMLEPQAYASRGPLRTLQDLFGTLRSI